MRGQTELDLIQTGVLELGSQAGPTPELLILHPHSPATAPCMPSFPFLLTFSLECLSPIPPSCCSSKPIFPSPFTAQFSCSALPFIPFFLPSTSNVISTDLFPSHFCPMLLLSLSVPTSPNSEGLKWHPISRGCSTNQGCWSVGPPQRLSKTLVLVA